MNIEQAKQIPLQKIVEHVGGRYSHDGRLGETWWFSPFRPEERTASFKINEKRNEWHDFARKAKVNAHGDVIDLLTDLKEKPRRESQAVKDALKELQLIAGKPYQNDYKAIGAKRKKGNENSDEPRYKFIKPPGRIWIDSLKAEIGRRGLTLATVNDTLKQAQVEDSQTGKRYNGFAFANDKGGYEISIPNPFRDGSFKTCIKPKTITSFFPENYNSVLIFEGFWDFYTWLQINQGACPHAHLILNSVVNMQDAVDLLIKRKHSVRFIFLFLDNDRAGKEAGDDIASLLEPHGFSIGTMMHLYEDYKDLSDFWTQSPSAMQLPMTLNKSRTLFKASKQTSQMQSLTHSY